MPTHNPEFNCIDCGFNTMTEYYMVHNALWAEAGMKPDGGMLCIGCLEDRLGRTLTMNDFTDAPVNHGYAEGYSPRLQARLSSFHASVR